MHFIYYSVGYELFLLHKLLRFDQILISQIILRSLCIHVFKISSNQSLAASAGPGEAEQLV